MAERLINELIQKNKKHHKLLDNIHALNIAIHEGTVRLQRAKAKDERERGFVSTATLSIDMRVKTLRSVRTMFNQYTCQLEDEMAELTTKIIEEYGVPLVWVDMN